MKKISINPRTGMRDSLNKTVSKWATYHEYETLYNILNKHKDFRKSGISKIRQTKRYKPQQQHFISKDVIIDIFSHGGEGFLLWIHVYTKNRYVWDKWLNKNPRFKRLWAKAQTAGM